MKNVEDMNAQYGVILEDTASSLTKGGYGAYTEHYHGKYNEKGN